MGVNGLETAPCVGIVARVNRELIHDCNTGEVRAFGSTITIEVEDPCSVLVGQAVSLTPILPEVDPDPCPRCGGPARVYECVDNWTVGCSDAHCMVLRSSYPSRAIAIRYWNMRGL